MTTGGGRFDFDDGGTYCGGWEDGKAHGHGVCTGPKSQGEYGGAWQFGYEISGVYTWPSGNTFSGQWTGGKRHGLGVEKKGKWIYKGEWTQGFKGRYGIRISESSGAKYEGTWANGLQDGYGSETYADGGSYHGQFMQGMRHGYGVRTSVPYGLASHYRPKNLRDSLTSLRSEEDDERTQRERDRKLDENRGGFVLRAKSEPPEDGSKKRRSSWGLVGERSSSLRKAILSGLKLKKQRSTGDIDDYQTSKRPASFRSSLSSTSYDSTQSQSKQSTLNRSARGASPSTAGDDHSFVSQDEITDLSTAETYMGEWKNDKRTGFGVAERSDGIKYEGEWFNNKKNGYGATTLRDGTRDEGKYKNNVLVTSKKKPGKLAMLRSSKLRDRLDTGVNQAVKAANIAAQKADIAISRTASARAKAEQAEIAARHAMDDADLARVKAKEFAPEFHPKTPASTVVRRPNETAAPTQPAREAFPTIAALGAQSAALTVAQSAALSAQHSMPHSATHSMAHPSQFSNANVPPSNHIEPASQRNSQYYQEAPRAGKNPQPMYKKSWTQDTGASSMEPEGPHQMMVGENARYGMASASGRGPYSPYSTANSEQRYSQPANSGYPPQANSGYSQQGDRGYPQPADRGFPQSADRGYPQPGDHHPPPMVKQHSLDSNYSNYSNYGDQQAAKYNEPRNPQRTLQRRQTLQRSQHIDMDSAENVSRDAVMNSHAGADPYGQYQSEVPAHMSHSGVGDGYSGGAAAYTGGGMSMGGGYTGPVAGGYAGPVAGGYAGPMAGGYAGPMGVNSGGGGSSARSRSAHPREPPRPPPSNEIPVIKPLERRRSMPSIVKIGAQKYKDDETAHSSDRLVDSETFVIENGIRKRVTAHTPSIESIAPPPLIDSPPMPQRIVMVSTDRLAASKKNQKSLPSIPKALKAAQAGAMTREEVNALSSKRREEIRRQKEIEGEGILGRTKEVFRDNDKSSDSNESSASLTSNPLHVITDCMRTAQNWFARRQLLMLVMFVNLSLCLVFLQLLS